MARAEHPEQFAGCRSVVSHERRPGKLYRLTDRGHVIELDCHYHDSVFGRPKAVMLPISDDGHGRGGWFRFRKLPVRDLKRLTAYLEQECVYLGRAPRQTYLLSTTRSRILARPWSVPDDLITLNDVEQRCISQNPPSQIVEQGEESLEELPVVRSS